MQWIYRDGEYRSTAADAAWRGDGTRRGVLPAPRATYRQNVTPHTWVTDAAIPYKQLDGGVVFLDASKLYGPNGTRASISWSGFRATQRPDKTSGTLYRAHGLPGDERRTAIHVWGGLTTIKAVVTDSEGATRDYVQNVTASGVLIDPFFDSKLSGDGRWVYMPYNGQAASRSFQIPLKLLEADRVVVDIEVLKAPAGVTVDNAHFEYTNAVREQSAYPVVTVNFPANLPNMSTVWLRSRSHVPSRPDLGYAWGDFYYIQAVRETAPLERQTMPDIYAPSKWMHLEAKRIPVASPSDPWSLVTDGLNVTPQESSVYVNELFRQRPNIGMTTDKFAPSVWLVDATTPRYRVVWDDSVAYGWDEEKPLWDNVPVPADAIPSNGTDGHIAMYDPVADQWWEFWQFHRTIDGGFAAVTGGRVDQFSTKQGQNKEHRHQWPSFTVSASGLALAPTMLKANEVVAAVANYDPADESKWDGYINHVLNVGVPQAKKHSFCWPATSTDGTHNDIAAPWEGQRFSIDPTLDLKTLGLTMGEHIIARACQRYGFMTTETAGSISIGCQSAHSWRLAKGGPGLDPYAPLFGGSGLQWDMLSKIPKSAFRAHRIFHSEEEFYGAVLPSA